ncbi:hypothetical protein JCM1840_005733 [Sporobolomyces johnsonii]
MQLTSRHLVSVPAVELSHLAGGEETVLFSGTLSLSLEQQLQPRPPPPVHPSRTPTPRKTPPPLPARPASRSSPPPPPSYSSSLASSSTPSPAPQQWLSLTLTLPADSSDPIFEMPVTPNPSSIVSVPPRSFVLPNLTGVDPASLASIDSHEPKETENGFIKLTLPVGLDPETHETVQAALYGHLNSNAPSRLDGSGDLRQSLEDAQPPERNQLYLVDENDGTVLGTLAGGVRLEEDSRLSAGKMHDHSALGAAPLAKGKEYAGGAAAAFDLDGAEAVVIDSSLSESIVSTSSAAGAAGSFSVKPLSAFYQPADNPTSSSIITVGNVVSRGIIVSTQLLAQGFEKGAGHYVASRPATETPMVFKESTKATWEKGHRWTNQAVVYSGRAVGVIGDLAAQLGDRIGKSTGIQRQPGGPPPTGVKGLLSTTLTAINTVADHLEAGGKTLLDSGSKSASQVIHHKYGAEARGVADDFGGSIKHCVLVYVDARGVTRRALLKSVGKGVLKAKMADGSELYLTNENGELKQIEAAAAATAAASTSNSASSYSSGTSIPVRIQDGARYSGKEKMKEA